MQLFLDLINNLMRLKLNSYAPNSVFICACTYVHTSTDHTATANTVVQRY